LKNFEKLHNDLIVQHNSIALNAFNAQKNMLYCHITEVKKNLESLCNFDEYARFGFVHAKTLIYQDQCIRMALKIYLEKFAELQLSAKLGLKQNLQNLTETVGKKFSNNELNQLADKGDLSQIVASNTANLNSQNERLKIRTTRIGEITENLQEVSELMNLMALKIDEQTKVLSEIENRFADTGQQMRVAQNNLIDARKYQRRSNRIKIILSAILSIVIVVLVLSLLKVFF